MRRPRAGRRCAENAAADIKIFSRRHLEHGRQVMDYFIGEIKQCKIFTNLACNYTMSIVCEEGNGFYRRRYMGCCLNPHKPQ